MAKRHSMPHGKSQRLFTRTAKRVNPRNVSPPPMRGGIRL